MSSAICEFWTRDGHVLLGVGDYHGTSDVLAPGIVDDRAEWHSADGWDARQACQHRETVEAWAYSWYGGGFHWPTSVCRECRVVKGELGPYMPDWGYSSPSPEQRAFWDRWRAEGWPKDGPPPGVADMDAR